MAKQVDTLRHLREAKAAFGRSLLAIPGVHGIGIGYKRKGRRKTRTLALVLHVHRKRPEAEIEPSHRIPPRLEFFSTSANKRLTVVTDVVEKAPPQPEACGRCDTDLGARVRPVAGGFSFGLATQPGGTLGGYVWDQTTKQVVFLSNHHVIGGTATATVIQPSIGDGGASPADDFGKVLRAGTLDASIGTVTRASDQELEIECSSPGVFEIADGALEMPLEKVGQTTGLTCGVVELIDYDSNHYGSHADLWIDGAGSDFSNPGDSGSLYVERTHPEGRRWKRVVGIHWGGSGNDGVGHPIRAVFNDLNLTTLCDGIITSIIESIFEAEAEPALALAPRLHAGIARDFEAAIRESKVGGKALALLREHRVGAVTFLSSGDGRRVTLAALAPILRGKLTVDEILAHKLTAADVRNWQRVLEVAGRVRPKARGLLEFGVRLLERVQGRTLRSVIFGRA
jgi:hypothetical protein